MSTLKLNGKTLATQTSSDEPVLASNVTGGGGLTALGTIASGTLGSAVVFNDAHKDVDVDADAWMRYPNTQQDASSNAVMVFDGVIKMGSNITYDGTSDYIQVAKAGWYLITINYTHESKQDRNVSIGFRKSASTGATPSGGFVLPRLYASQGNDGVEYWGKSQCGYIYLDATDRIDVYGTFYTYGSPAIEHAMTLFTGVRVGA